VKDIKKILLRQNRVNRTYILNFMFDSKQWKFNRSEVISSDNFDLPNKTIFSRIFIDQLAVDKPLRQNAKKIALKAKA
jgi:hypothetical protein